MNWLTFLFFSFQGRIKRLTWFLALIAFVVVSVLTEEGLRWALNIPAPPTPPNLSITELFKFDNLSILMYLIFMWPGLAIDIKRLHDMNWSGWFALIAWGPVTAFMIWSRSDFSVIYWKVGAGLLAASGLMIIGYFIVLVAVKGTHGRNRFGPEPG